MGAVKMGNEEEKKKDDKEDKTEKAKMDVDADANDDEEQKVDVSKLETGYYELCGIVTHKGRSANSGHYIGYAKDTARKMWLKFDDEDTTEIKSDYIKQLYGGGVFQMAFLCIFRRVENE